MLKIFILGLLIGAVIGVGIMCLCIASKNGNEE